MSAMIHELRWDDTSSALEQARFRYLQRKTKEYSFRADPDDLHHLDQFINAELTLWNGRDGFAQHPGALFCMVAKNASSETRVVKCLEWFDLARDWKRQQELIDGLVWQGGTANVMALLEGVYERGELAHQSLVIQTYARLRQKPSAWQWVETTHKGVTLAQCDLAVSVPDADSVTLLNKMTGHEHSGVRQAAYCGLVSLGHLDWLDQAQQALVQNPSKKHLLCIAPMMAVSRWTNLINQLSAAKVSATFILWVMGISGQLRFVDYLLSMMDSEALANDAREALLRLTGVDAQRNGWLSLDQFKQGIQQWWQSNRHRVDQSSRYLMGQVVSGELLHRLFKSAPQNVRWQAAFEWRGITQAEPLWDHRRNTEQPLPDQKDQRAACDVSLVAAKTCIANTPETCFLNYIAWQDGNVAISNGATPDASLLRPVLSLNLSHRWERILALLSEPDICQSLQEHHGPVFFALPQLLPEEHEQRLTWFWKQLSESCGYDFDWNRSQAFAQGRSAGLVAIEHAKQYVTEHDRDSLVVAVDSLCDANTRSRRPDDLLGEGVLVFKVSAQPAVKPWPEIRIATSNLPFASKDVEYLLEHGLASAAQEVLAELPEEDVVKSVWFTDLYDEALEEETNAMLSAHQENIQWRQLDLPSTYNCFGDTGAMWGALNLTLACETHVHGQGSSALVAVQSDHVYRAVALISG